MTRWEDGGLGNTYDNDRKLNNELSGFPVPHGQRFHLILVTHDESTFYENDRRKTTWGINRTSQSRSYQAIKLPLISKNAFEQERIFNDVGAIDTIVAMNRRLDWIVGKHVGLRSHNRPRSSMFLGQHKRREIDFAKGPGAQDTFIAEVIVFLIIRAKDRSKDKEGKFGMASLDCIAYTKCLRAVPIPPF